MYDFESNREKPSSHSGAYDLHPDFQLLGATDEREGQSEYLNQLVPDASFYCNAIEMLKQYEFDVISICTPPKDRFNLLKNIIENSNPRILFCEKPIVCNVSEVPQIHELFTKSKCLLIPNLSRRWNKGIRKVKEAILQKKFGTLDKIHLRYTRGIYNTGSHIFDLIRFFAGEVNEVRVLHKVLTSSDLEGEPSFSFIFTVNQGTGFAEAFNDDNYYMFEIDLYFQFGKIEILYSGDEIRYYNTDKHPLFKGYNSLYLQKAEKNLLKDSNLYNAIDHISQILKNKENPICTLEDGIYPLFVAEALLKSYHNHGSLEKVVTTIE